VFIVILWAIVKSFAPVPSEPQVSISVIIFLLGFILQDVAFKTQTSKSHLLRYKNEIISRSTPCNRLSQPPRDTRVKVTLVTRPLLTPVAQNLRRCEHGVF
jgi:hypothetical protein